MPQLIFKQKLYRSSRLFFKDWETWEEHTQSKCKRMQSHCKLFRAWHVLLLFVPNVKKESLGAISVVDESMSWCERMVVIPKMVATLEFVDLKSLNPNVLQEVHPKVDETMAQFSGGKLFSRPDTNRGFWKVPPHRILKSPNYVYNTILLCLL